MNSINATYCDISGVEYIPKEIKELIGNRNITTNIYRIQKFDSMLYTH